MVKTMGRGASKIVLFTEGRSPEVNSTILEAPRPIVLTRNSKIRQSIFVLYLGINSFDN